MDGDELESLESEDFNNNTASTSVFKDHNYAAPLPVVQEVVVETAVLDSPRDFTAATVNGSDAFDEDEKTEEEFALKVGKTFDSMKGVEAFIKGYESKCQTKFVKRSTNSKQVCFCF